MVLVPAVRKDVRGRGLPGLGIGWGRRRQILNFHGTPEDEDVRGPRFLTIYGRGRPGRGPGR